MSKGINVLKCAIIGCGNVGATCAYTLSIGSLFSEIVLIDVNKAKAEGEAMDINHGIPFARPVKVYAGDYDNIYDAKLVIIAAGAAQREGETRRDLIQNNAEVFYKIIPEIVKRNKECILLIVSNPVDILTYMAKSISGFPASRVIGSGTVLDTARFKYLLGEQLLVDSRNIHAFIIGEHGDSELAVWSSANVSGIDLEDYCRLDGSCGGTEKLNEIYEEVKNSAYNIIERKGATYYAIAMAVRRIAESIVRNEHSVLTVSSVIDSHYGLNEVALSVPCIVGSNGIERVLDIALNEEEYDKLMNSAAILTEMQNMFVEIKK